MCRHVEHPGVVVEDVLRAIAVMDVPVDDRHALALLGQMRRSDGDIVEQTEAHRPVGHGMVPGRATGREGHLT